MTRQSRRRQAQQQKPPDFGASIVQGIGKDGGKERPAYPLCALQLKLVAAVASENETDDSVRQKDRSPRQSELVFVVSALSAAFASP